MVVYFVQVCFSTALKFNDELERKYQCKLGTPKIIFSEIEADEFVRKIDPSFLNQHFTTHLFCSIGKVKKNAQHFLKFACVALQVT